MSHIHVLHENREWTAPLYKELGLLGLPYRIGFWSRDRSISPHRHPKEFSTTG